MSVSNNGRIIRKEIPKEAASQHLDAKSLERLAIEEALQEADKGVFVSNNTMRSWIASWGSNDELPPPIADVFVKENCDFSQG